MMYERRKVLFVKTNKGTCPFCREKKEPDYKQPEALGKYLTDRGKLLGKDQTGVCSHHQRRLAIEIKRARHLALLPFVSS